VNWRLFFIGACLMMFGSVNALLVFNEEIVLPDEKTQAESRASDPLFGMCFIAS
jgi:hypothetical protein